MTAPALFELAQNSPTNLADRLKAIRGNVTTDYGTSSRRTSSRGSVSPAAPAPLTESPEVSEAAESAESTTAPNLPSVLVRRRNQDAPAPLVEAGQPLQGASAAPTHEGLGDAFSDTGDELDSSRRTARRWRAQPPAFEGSSAFQSDSATGGSRSLALSEQGPALRIETEGPKAISVGKEAIYRIRLVNDGPVAAQRVIVTASVPSSVQFVLAQARLGTAEEQTDLAGVRQVVWSMDQVTASSQQELAISLKATESRPVDLRVDWTYRPASLSAQIEVQQPQLAVSVEGPVEMRFGETKVFKVKLNNPGNGPAENVTVNIDATGASSQPNTVGTLAAGESRTLELELTANQAGAMQIQAVARGDSELQAQAAHEVRVRRAALAVQITAPQLLFAGTTAAYQIRVANQGDAVAEGVVMQIELPAGAKNGIGVDKKPITIEQPRWRIGDLSPGAERVYSMQCDLSASGQNQLVARLQSGNSEGIDSLIASDTATTTVEAIADLKLVVNDPPGPVQIGTDVVYEIQVMNRGSKEATNVSLVAQFSEGVEPSAATGHRSEIVPGQVIFDPIEKIPAGGQVSLKITARAAQGGNLRFRAELTCGDPETKLVAEENTRFYGAPAGSPAPPQSADRSGGEPTPARR